MSDEIDTFKPTGLSRRGFLKGLGVGSVATGLLSPVSLKEALAKEEGVVGPGEVSVTLKINGQGRKLDVEPRVTLLDALRNRLELTGCNHFTASYEGGNAEGRWVGRAVEWMKRQ